jgi:hypothetical protein
MAYTNIDDPSAYFQTTTYTGAGADTEVTNSGNSDLKPDLLWIKNRTAGYAHFVVDSNRNISYAQNSSNAPYLETDSTAAENNNQNWMASVNTNGFTTGISEHINNNSGSAYVAWQWKANGGTTTAFSESGSNPGGTYQKNETAGFSIVTYTGTGTAGEVQHGLSTQPQVVIVKRRDDTSDWPVYHESIGIVQTLFLNKLDAQLNTSSYFHTGWGAATKFPVGTNAATNADGATYVAYVFLEKQGYSKFGKYTGAGSGSPFVYTGFKPALVICKRTDSTNDWGIVDSKRETYNGATKTLFADLTNAESSTYTVDLLSNGFKPSSNHSIFNQSGGSYIYMAFAENPFVTSTGVPATAR